MFCYFIFKNPWKEIKVHTHVYIFRNPFSFHLEVFKSTFFKFSKQLMLHIWIVFYFYLHSSKQLCTKTLNIHVFHWKITQNSVSNTSKIYSNHFSFVLTQARTQYILLKQYFINKASWSILLLFWTKMLSFCKTFGKNSNPSTSPPLKKIC